MIAIANLRFDQITVIRDPKIEQDVLLGLDPDGQVWAYDHEHEAWDRLSMRPGQPDAPHEPFSEGATIVDHRRRVEDQIGMVIGRGMVGLGPDAVPYTIVRYQLDTITYLRPEQ